MGIEVYINMNLAYAGQKFRKTAIYYPHISSNDGERLSYSIQGLEFKCSEFELTRVNRMILAEGINANAPTLAIITTDPRAIGFEPDDKINYNDHDYNILYRGKIKNYATPNSVAYVIGLN